jgi:hypothetical protein
MTEERPDLVALPPTGDGSRRARSSSGSRDRGRRAPTPGTGQGRRGRSPRLPWFLAGVGVVVVAVLLVALTLGGGGGTRQPTPSSTPVGRGGRVSGLLLQRDRSGGLVSATLLVVARSGAGGDVVYIPPATLAETAALGLVPLREGAVDGDALVRTTIENVLGERIGAVATVDPASLAAAVQPAGMLQFDGAAVGPEAVADLLARPGVTDLDRLVRHQAFWTAWLARIRRAGARAAPSSAALGPLAADVRALAAGTVTHHLLPVVSVDGADGLYRIDQAKLPTFLRAVLPDAPAPDHRVAAQVLNGTGVPGTVQALVSPLVQAGARVVLTGNADRFDYTATQIVYFDDAHAVDARRLRDALGVGQVVRGQIRSGVVDITVVVGSDFRSSTRGTTTTSRGANP